MLISSSLLPRLLAHPPSPLRYRCKPRTISFRSPVSRLHHYTTRFNWELPLENSFVYLSWLVNISKEFTFDKFFIYLFKTCVLQLENMHCIFNEKPHRPRSSQSFMCIISQILTQLIECLRFLFLIPWQCKPAIPRGTSGTFVKVRVLSKKDVECNRAFSEDTDFLKSKVSPRAQMNCVSGNVLLTHSCPGCFTRASII